MERYEFRKTNHDPTPQDKYQARLEEVELIVDKLGKPIDIGIKEAVAILRAMDFPTNSSCTGHTDKDGCGAPYIDICSEAPEGWKNDVKKQEEWRSKNLSHYLRMEELLKVFYLQRHVLAYNRLMTTPVGIFGAFRLESFGNSMTAEDLNIKTENDFIEKITEYQEEMKAFTDYLKKSFLHT